MKPPVDPEQAVKEILIAQSTQGIQQSKLTALCTRYMSSQELQVFLHELRDDRKADKYTVGSATFWRATTEILND